MKQYVIGLQILTQLLKELEAYQYWTGMICCLYFMPVPDWPTGLYIDEGTRIGPSEIDD